MEQKTEKNEKSNWWMPYFAMLLAIPLTSIVNRGAEQNSRNALLDSKKYARPNEVHVNYTLSDEDNDGNPETTLTFTKDGKTQNYFMRLDAQGILHVVPYEVRETTSTLQVNKLERKVVELEE